MWSTSLLSPLFNPIIRLALFRAALRFFCIGLFLQALNESYPATYKAHTRIDDTGKSYNVKKYTEHRTLSKQLKLFFTLALYTGRLRVTKGKKEIIKSHAQTKGESMNGFINRAIDETIERDSTT